MTAPTQEKKNYKSTLNLPQTQFPMEAKLTQTEPARLARWRETFLYKRIIAHRTSDPKSKGKWILHDGPPFANGDIHIGHLINKTLKDVILRFRSMQGYVTPYVPGWDCHGLPIEHKIQQDLGPKLRQMSVVEVRKLCYDYAEKYTRVQSEQFQRLGILGEWDKPYLTMNPLYEADTLEVFARFVEAGLVYKKLKPVPWSIENQTALADAELEYWDEPADTVWVEFPLRTKSDATHLAIWTTTPWTLPANLAVAVNPKLDYCKVQYERDGQTRVVIMREEFLDHVFGGPVFYKKIGKVVGAELIGLDYQHPFIDRTGKVVGADWVTGSDGTGLVHIAPGHGEEDYATGIANGLEIYCPVLANGRYDESVPEWLRGKTIREANPLIIARLKDSNLLIKGETINHSYPHDWRSKKPIIFRATEQWFIAMDKPCSPDGDSGPAKTLRDRALEAAGSQVDFVPEWGRSRLVGMLQSRPDWCVSRQRAWGLPIPVFYNEKGKALLTPESVRAVAKRFAEKGSDAWFAESPAELLGANFRYPSEFSPGELRKEKDIFDVWFESGSSWHAVLQARSYLHFPADLYLEGSDQHRGWFQLSLLPSLGATGKPPFKQVLTHGFVVKPDGTKVSKSDKEYVTATQEVNRHGADVLRLWCCSVDYQNDIPTSPAAIQEFGDKYRKIRNTLRYLLSNLYDFNPHANSRPAPMASLDAWISWKLDQLIVDVTAAYDAYQMHRVFRLLHDFCAVEISAVYGNAMKDRLYCDAPDSPLRRRSQTVMYRIASALTRLIAPIMVFTADEAWEYIPHKSGEDAAAESVHMLTLPKVSGVEPSEAQIAEWKALMDARDLALAQLDLLKKQKGLNKALDAQVKYTITMRDAYAKYGPDLEDIVGAGCHDFFDPTDGEAVMVVDIRQQYKACARSWKRRPDVGSDGEYPDLSKRDAEVVRAIQSKQGE
jgi:isoleucyl-tRNA synthetase